MEDKGRGTQRKRREKVEDEVEKRETTEERRF